MNNLSEPLLNEYEIINDEIHEVTVDDEITTINYRYNIPDRTVIHYLKNNERYSGSVLDNRIYGPRKEFDQSGYIHTTMIKLNDGTKDDLYFQIYQNECIEMKHGNCIILNPLIE
jgi:hypothetical protein